VLHSVLQRCLLWLLVFCLSSSWFCATANAAKIDPYVARYLDVAEPVALALDDQGNTRSFTAVDLSQGKVLFGQNCLNCHVGGNTLPNPLVPLSLSALHGATPRRDTIAGLVSYLRQPMTYDGREAMLLCQQVPESWLDDSALENLAAFILRAAQKAPAWGTENFQG